MSFGMDKTGYGHNDDHMPNIKISLGPLFAFGGFYTGCAIAFFSATPVIVPSAFGGIIGYLIGSFEDKREEFDKIIQNLQEQKQKEADRNNIMHLEAEIRNVTRFKEQQKINEEQNKVNFSFQSEIKDLKAKNPLLEALNLELKNSNAILKANCAELKMNNYKLELKINSNNKSDLESIFKINENQIKSFYDLYSNQKTYLDNKFDEKEKNEIDNEIKINKAFNKSFEILGYETIKDLAIKNKDNRIKLNELSPEAERIQEISTDLKIKNIFEEFKISNSLKAY